LADLPRGWHPVARLHQMRLMLLTDDVHAEFDAFVADENRRTGDEFADFVLRLAAERTVQGVLRIAGFGHAHSSPANRGTMGNSNSLYAAGTRTAESQSPASPEIIRRTQPYKPQ